MKEKMKNAQFHYDTIIDVATIGLIITLISFLLFDEMNYTNKELWKALIGLTQINTILIIIYCRKDSLMALNLLIKRTFSSGNKGLKLNKKKLKRSIS